MSNSASPYLKYAAVLAGIVVLIAVSYIGFLYVSYIDRTVTAGSAYGFTIGESKADAYRIAQAQFRGGDITGIDTLRSREEEVKLFPGINGNESYHTVAEVRDWFDNWDHWSLWMNGDPPTLLAILRFRGDQITAVDAPGAVGEVWRVPSSEGITFRVGQSYAEAYGALEALSRTPVYQALVVDTGWMARRQPVEFGDAEYRFVEDYDEWTLLMRDSRLNSVRLTFDQGRLLRIHRHRQYFELP